MPRWLWAAMLIVVPALVGLTVAGCGGDRESDGTATARPEITRVACDEPGVGGKCATDLKYHSGRDWQSQVDVYAPPEGAGRPVVVLLHGSALNKNDWLYVSLANKLVARGAVVFVPNWGNVNLQFPDDPDEARAQGLLVGDAAGCAVAFAAARAPAYGGDPDRLVVFGHSAGAGTAAVLALRPVDAFPGCNAGGARPQIDRLVLWEADLLLEDPFWSRYGKAIAKLQQAYTPWSWLSSAPRMPVTLAVSAGGRELLRSCGVSTSREWSWRDPEGWFRRRLEAIRALEDDCVDIGETHELLADVMRERGFDVREVALPDSSHTYLGPADERLLARETLAPTR